MNNYHDKCICCFNASAKVVIPRRANTIFCCIFTNNVATTTLFRKGQSREKTVADEWKRGERKEERGERLLNA